MKKSSFLLSAAMLVASSLTVSAAIRTVTNLNDSGAGSLRGTIAAAASGDTIRFSLTGTIVLTSGTLIINKNLTIEGPGDPSVLVITRSTAQGALKFRLMESSNRTVSLSGLTLTGGYAASAVDEGGGAYRNVDGSLTITNCAFTNNLSESRPFLFKLTGGGAIESIRAATMTVDRCTFTGNSTLGCGGAVSFIDGGTLTISHSLFRENTAGCSGGGISASGSGGLTTMVACTLEHNQTEGSGGGIEIDSDVSEGFTFTRCLLYANSAFSGGGISSKVAGPAILENCTLSSNVVQTDGAGGGGIFHGGTGSLSVTACTFADNSAQNSIGVARSISTISPNSIVTLRNTILAGRGPHVVLAGAFISGGFNLIQDTTWLRQRGPNDLIGVAAALDPLGLQDHGGPTKTIALLSTSPAVDRGKAFGLTMDQRNVQRPIELSAYPNAAGGDGSDIGAFESRDPLATPLVVTTLHDHDDGVAGVGDCTLREAINRANALAPRVTSISFLPGLEGTLALDRALGALNITGSVRLTGPGARSLALSSNTQSRLLSIAGGTSVISGLTLRDGFVAGGAPGGANSGGAVFNQANVTFLDCTFSNNRAVGSSGSSPGGNGGSGSGGAIANSGTLTVERCTFQGNGASGGFGADNPPPDDFTQTTGGSGGTARGAAIFNETGRNLTVRNCTFFGNNAGGASAGNGHHGGTGGSGLGGAICNFGTMTVTGGTCSGNSGFGGSGGLGRFSFTNGAAGRGVGGLAVGGSGTSTVRNTISANNTGNNGGGDVDGVFVSEGYNLIRIGTFSSGFNQTGDQVGTAAVPIDALLGALQNNGGPTDTMAVLAGSPARDQGKALGLTTDQRGQPRPNDNPALPNAVGGDGSEIGAFELSGRTYTVTSTAESALEICDDGDCTLRGAIGAANATPDPDIIRFAPGVTGTILLDGALPTLNRDVAIEGPGAHLLTLRRNTGGDYRILTISNGTSVGPTVSVSGLTLANGNATGSFPNNSGGGILNDHGHLTLHRVVVSGNVAASFGGGGGVYNYGANSGIAHLVVTDSTFLTNNGHLGGSAIYNDGNNGGSAFLTLTNSTLSQNAAGFNSATILNAASGGSATVVATNCTLADNLGSGFSNNDAGGSMALRNNLLKAGLFGSANLVLGSGTIVSLGHNLSSDAAGGDGGTGPGGFLNATGDLRNANPQLDPAGAVDHGGPTPTHALLGGSPAINAGNHTFAPPMDQRGFLRAGPSDIGAFEFMGAPLHLTSIRRLANGDVIVEAMGVPGAMHMIERSVDLSATGFGPLAPATADSSGRIEYTDTSSADLDRAFYRLTFP